MTDGAIGHSGTISTFASCGYNDGTTLIYTLTNSASGSDVTNIVVYSGWGDTGRYGQYYYLSYSTIAAPLTYIPLTTVYYLPPGSGAPATRVAIARLDGSKLAGGVAKIKFDFASPPNAAGFNNGWQGYSEIIVQGTATQTVAKNPTNLVFQVTGSTLTLSWPADHTGWRLQAQTNSVAQALGTNWSDVAGTTASNQMAIPISTAKGSVFFPDDLSVIWNTFCKIKI